MLSTLNVLGSIPSIKTIITLIVITLIIVRRAWSMSIDQAELKRTANRLSNSKGQVGNKQV
jgi:hypothetical protein